MRRLRWFGFAILTGFLLAVVQSETAGGQEIFQYGFEGRDPIWVQGEAKAAYQEVAHKISEDFARGGQRSECFKLDVQQGDYIYYTFNVGRAPVNDELTASIWARANRVGIQLMARVVLPHEPDPHNLQQPVSVIIKGDSLPVTSRWQLLSIPQPVKRLNEKLTLLRADLKHEINLADAYVDQLILNLYTGPGTLEAYVDDLEVGPVLGTTQIREAPGGNPAVPASSRRPDDIHLAEGDPSQFFVGVNKKIFPRGIRNSGTPMKTLKDALFNVVWLDESAAPGLIEDAVAQDLYIVPTLTVPPAPQPGQATLTSNPVFATTVQRFLASSGSIAWWGVGNDVDADQLNNVVFNSKTFHTQDPRRPLAIDLATDFVRLGSMNRTENPVMVGAHREPLMTAMEMSAYRDFLVQRRKLADAYRPGVFCWTWIQTHLPDWFMTAAYDRPANGSFTEPIGPQPDQIRLMAWVAIGAGYRGLSYSSDRFLADTHTGRDRLLALARINQEVSMLESILVDAFKDPEWIETPNPNVKAAVLRTRTAILVLPMWMGPGSQFVPAQGAVSNLKIIVPAVPLGYQAWEVSPQVVQSFKSVRKLGGTEITLHEFCLTSAIVFTADLSGMVVKFQQEQQKLAPSAAQWAYDEAREELAKVEYVNRELEQLGQKLPDGDALLEKARAFLESSLAHRKAGDYAEGCAEADRAQRPLRVLMRAHWERAVKALGGQAVASPYAVSFYTLPRHWRFWDEVSRMRIANNVLAGGDFETPNDQREGAGWGVTMTPHPQSQTVGDDPVLLTIGRVAEAPKEGKQCLKLEVKPRDPAIPPTLLEHTSLALASPAVRLQPGSLVRLSAWIKVPKPIIGSADGVLFFDSAGGEPLAIHIGEAKDWKQFILYRRVPASGTVNVTMALTGIGTAFFDDVRIEPLVAGAAAAAR